MAGYPTFIGAECTWAATDKAMRQIFARTKKGDAKIPSSEPAASYFVVDR